jgi:predicted restriction endonuclease
MNIKLPFVKIEEFKKWLKNNINSEFRTIAQGKVFTLYLDSSERVTFIPSSSNKKRSPLSDKNFSAYIKKYNEIRSLTPSEYKGHNRSYITSLISTFLSDKHNENMEFEVASFEDVLRNVKVRQGQPEFRKKLMKEFLSRCVVTGCSIVSLLEAAHIVPHKEKTNYDTSNGLLLRADIHTLYDMELLRIDEKGNVILCDEIKNDKTYSSLLKQKKIDSDFLTIKRQKQLKDRFELKYKN